MPPYRPTSKSWLRPSSLLFCGNFVDIYVYEILAFQSKADFSSCVADIVTELSEFMISCLLKRSFAWI